MECALIFMIIWCATIPTVDATMHIRYHTFGSWPILPASAWLIQLRASSGWFWNEL